MSYRFFALFIITLLVYSTLGQIINQYCTHKMASGNQGLALHSTDIAGYPCEEEEELPAQDPIPNISFVDILETEATLFDHNLCLSILFDISYLLPESPRYLLRQGCSKCIFPPPEVV